MLVKTSNPSSDDFEEIEDKNGKPLYISVLEAIKNWGEDFLGNSGYSAIGAVVGVNHLKQIIHIREVADGRVFLSRCNGKGADRCHREVIKFFLMKESLTITCG